MKKIPLAFLILSALAGWYVLPRAIKNGQAATAAPAPLISNEVSAPPTITPTFTPIPTATIDYQQTAAVAQSTAWEAVRVNAQITAEYEQRIMQQIQITAEAERQYHEVLAWTVTAANTSIPLTATQQAALNTQIPEAQSVMLAQITATWGAPTQIMAIANANTSITFMKTERIIRLMVFGALGFLSVALGIFLIRVMREPRREIEPEQEIEPQAETIIMAKRETAQGMGSIKRYVVPVSPEQLTRLAELAVNGERTFAINRIEQMEGPLKNQRATLYKFRNWAIANNFAFHPKPGDQQIVMNDEGNTFLEIWFENHRLEDGYEFGEKDLL